MSPNCLTPVGFAAAINQIIFLNEREKIASAIAHFRLVNALDVANDVNITHLLLYHSLRNFSVQHDKIFSGVEFLTVIQLIPDRSQDTNLVGDTSKLEEF